MIFDLGIVCREALYVLSFRIKSIQALHRFLIPAKISTSSSKRSKSTYIVNTIPPLKISLASLGTAPDQNVIMPSSLKIFAAQSKLFLYRLRASIDCMLFLVS